MTLERQYCTFCVGDLFLGVEVLKVQEVIRSQVMTKVPLAHEAVRGLINLRGQIVTGVDLRQRLGLGASTSGREPMNVVIRTGDDTVSLLVDTIGDVVDVDETLHEDPPPTLPPQARGLITRVYKLPNRLLLTLDCERVLALEPSGAPQ